MKVLIVDDHSLIREALGGVLKELISDVEIYQSQDSRQAMQCLNQNPDLELILLDLYLPDGSGFDILANLGERAPALSVVVLSASSDSEDITRALDLGAVGFIPKSAPRDVIVGALRLIFSGGIYVPPEILNRHDGVWTGVPPTPRPPSAAELGLTARQMEVLALMLQGKSNKVICRILDIAEPTVKNHVTSILRALKVTNRTEAVIAVNALGLKFDEDTG